MRACVARNALKSLNTAKVFVSLQKLNISNMAYSVQDKLEWTIIFVREFGRKYGLTMKQSFNYLSRYKGIDFVDRNYAYVHTQSYASMINDIAEYCHRKGGALL